MDAVPTDPENLRVTKIAARSFPMGHQAFVNAKAESLETKKVVQQANLPHAMLHAV